MSEPEKAKTSEKSAKRTSLKVVATKDAKAKMAPAKKGGLVKGATTEAPVGMIDAEKLRDTARQAYGNFQKSWYEFAKVVATVSNNEVWTTLGHDSFKAYCAEEFRDFGYPTIVKFIQVVNNWGDAIEDRLKKNPKQVLPSYETCYTLTASQERFPKGEVPKLRKQVLDGKISVADMREKVAEVKGTADKKSDDATSRKIQKDIENAAPLSVKLAEGKGVDDAVDLIEGKVDFLIDNIPLVTKALGGEVTEKLVNLATKIQDKLMDQVLNDFLDRVADIAEEGYAE